MTDGASSWMIHGVVRASAPRPQEAPDHVRAAFGGLAALLSPGHAPISADPSGAAPAGPLEAEAAATIAHNLLLTAYALETDVAPLRYGAAVLGPDAACALLASETSRYEAVLARVGGGLEYALRVTGGPAPVPAAPDAAAPDAVTGRAHLAAQRPGRVARDAPGAARAACVAAVAAEAVSRARECVAAPARAGCLLDLALLVPRGEAAALVEAAALWRARTARCGLTLSLIGPWPPYSFTQAGAESARAPE